MAKIGSFRFWCQKVLPLVYDDSLSYYELLCKVVHKLNECIDAVNQVDIDTINATLESFKEYMLNYFDNLDVQEEINKKLDEMAESGALQEILTKVWFAEPKGFMLDVEYQYTRTKLFRDSPMASGTNNPAEPQGIAFYNKQLITAYTTGYYSGHDTLTSSCLVERVTLGDTPSDNTLSNSYTVTGLGHANDMCYNPDDNLIYVAVGEYYDTDTSSIIYTPRIITMSPSTMSIQSTIDVDMSDVIAEWGSSYYYFSHICYYNNSLYVCKNSYVSKIDLSTGKASPVGIYNTNGMTVIGLGAYQGYIYLMGQTPNAVYVYGIDSKELIRICTLPECDCWGNPLRYTESMAMDLDTGDCYVDSWAAMPCDDTSSNRNYLTTHVHKFNPVFGVQGDRTSVRSNTITRDDRKYVSKSAGIYQTGVNDYPYEYFTQWTWARENQPRWNRISCISNTVSHELLHVPYNLRIDNSFTVDSIFVDNANLWCGSSMNISGENINSSGAYPLKVINGSYSMIGSLTLTGGSSVSDSLMYCIGSTLNIGAVNYTGSTAVPYMAYFTNCDGTLYLHYNSLAPTNYMSGCNFNRAILTESGFSLEVGNSGGWSFPVASGATITVPSTYVGQVMFRITCTINGSNLTINTPWFSVGTNTHFPMYFGSVRVTANLSDLTTPTFYVNNLTGDSVEASFVVNQVYGR